VGRLDTPERFPYDSRTDSKLVVDDKGGSMFDKILVCLDGSELAEQILPYAAELARKLDSRLILLEVTLPPSAAVESLTGYYRATPLEKVLREEAEARAYLNRVAQRLRKKGTKVSTVTMPGDPGRTILDVAGEQKAGLIVLGTHGRSGLRRLVFGSVTEFVVQHSELPVLVKKPQSAEKSQV
jgi:nucleotide-binding universal stress UspA family protein